ncbi:glycoside hydrolase family 15 protein [Jiangella sp. DSM 45060]|uniref:glycoside hydrolase family 15 protein n=1 Tax=Jiangella sp. DSM 45060 TaxID=1798224 RepID=UPI000B83BD9B|nr:glycoside hydrolase family 15 protein [Jiangella sp. DSM 45060]
MSVELIAGAQDPSGAYPAAVGFAPYGFCWFRDGAFIAEGMSRAGAVSSATAFHEWSARVLEREASAIASLVARVAAGEQPSDAELLPARYTLAGDRHDDDWWNYQVDGYGTWLWALRSHLTRWDLPLAPYAAAAEVAVRYLVAVGARPCRDWWEEHRDHTHVSTLASVYGGLRAAASLGVLPSAASAAADEISALVTRSGTLEGALRKWLGSTAVDASLMVAGVPFGLVPPGGPVDRATVARITSELSVLGGPAAQGSFAHGPSSPPVPGDPAAAAQATLGAPAAQGLAAPAATGPPASGGPAGQGPGGPGATTQPTTSPPGPGDPAAQGLAAPAATGPLTLGATTQPTTSPLAPGGGVHRYVGDTFYGGGQWPILAAFLGWHHAVAGSRERAAELLRWIASTADSSGSLPEQVPPLLAPDRLAEWTDRWGPSARPLLWSHGMYLVLASSLDVINS